MQFYACDKIRLNITTSQSNNILLNANVATTWCWLADS